MHLSNCDAERSVFDINPEFRGRGSYSATSNDMKLVHWPLMGELLHLVQQEGNYYYYYYYYKRKD